MQEIHYITGPNPDIEKRRTIIRKINANGGYCITQKQRGKDTKCRCRHFQETGECYCGLFVILPFVEVGV